MTNYGKLKKEFFKNPKFVKAYREATIERKIAKALEELEDRIKDEKPPINKVLKMINLFRTKINEGKFAS